MSEVTHRSRLLLEARAALWSIPPARLVAILDVLEAHAAGERLDEAELAHALGSGPRLRPRVVIHGSVAVLGLHGIIAHRSAERIQDVSGPGITSIDGFRQRLRDALAAPSVSAIVIDVGSSGGVTEGVQELADEIQQARKPIVAVANANATGTAYWLASAAGSVSVTSSGRVGGIGVVSAHEDVSRRMVQKGIGVTLVAAGKYKIEGHPFGPLGASARAHRQGRVDERHRVFLAAVSRGRGVPLARVASDFGQGRAVGAHEAVAKGMSDRVETLDQAIARLQTTPSTRQRGPNSPAAFEFWR